MKSWRSLPGPVPLVFSLSRSPSLSLSLSLSLCAPTWFVSTISLLLGTGVTLLHRYAPLSLLSSASLLLLRCSVPSQILCAWAECWEKGVWEWRKGGGRRRGGGGGEHPRCHALHQEPQLQHNGGGPTAGEEHTAHWLWFVVIMNARTCLLNTSASLFPLQTFTKCGEVKSCTISKKKDKTGKSYFPSLVLPCPVLFKKNFYLFKSGRE